MYTHLLLLFSIKNGYAYLDPGTGNILIQIIAAVAASAAIYIGFVWHKIKLFILKVKKIMSKKKDDTDKR